MLNLKIESSSKFCPTGVFAINCRIDCFPIFIFPFVIRLMCTPSRQVSITFEYKSNNVHPTLADSVIQISIVWHVKCVSFPMSSRNALIALHFGYTLTLNALTLGIESGKKKRCWISLNVIALYKSGILVMMPPSIRCSVVVNRFSSRRNVATAAIIVML